MKVTLTLSLSDLIKLQVLCKRQAASDAQGAVCPNYSPAVQDIFARDAHSFSGIATQLEKGSLK